MLLEVRRYLEQRGAASILDLACHFGSEPEALRGMLDHWIRKGVIVRRDFGGSCGGCASQGHCGGCGVLASFEVYEMRNAG